MIGHNETQLDSYNKNIPRTQGTLMANWFEERVHRENKGVGRATTKSHLPKKHQELLLSTTIPTPLPEDDTKYRVLGDTDYRLPRTENYHYGKGCNKADNLQKIGKRQQLLEHLYLKEVKLSIEDQQKRKQEQNKRGTFETTNGNTFTPKPLHQNQVGKLIMYDQSGNHIESDTVDHDLRQSLGLKERGQITNDQELRKLVDTQAGYQKQQPVTFWREKLEEGTFYMSKAGGQPFSKNNDFLKTFQHYKHYKD